MPICDSIGGLVAAFSICAALVRRAGTGEGAFLDVSMLEAAIASMGWVVSDQLDRRARRPPNGETRTPPRRRPGTFDTADGKLNIAANKQEQFETLCGVLDRTDLLADTRFATRDSRRHHRDELREELEKTLAQRSAREWDEYLTHSGVPAAPVVSVREALESKHIRARGLVHTVRFAVRARRHTAPARQPGPRRRAGHRTRGSATTSRRQYRRSTRRDTKTKPGLEDPNDDD